MKIRWLAVLLVAAPCLAEEPYEVATASDVMVAMRDGVRLATDVHRPARGGKPVEGTFPVILERTPYDKTKSMGAVRAFVPKGYVVISQDVRGRYASEGRWRPLRDDQHDGYDTLEWLGKQPWFDAAGGVGTIGGSYPGATQHALALAHPPYLKAMVPIVAMSNSGYFGIRHQGAFELRFFNWIFNLGFAPAPLKVPNTDPAAAPALLSLRDQVMAYARALPLRRGTTPLHEAPDYEDWLVEAMSHGDVDAYWTEMGEDVVDHVADYKDIPVYHVTGWYDSWPMQVANMNFVALAKAKRSLQRLLVGPWTHNAGGTFAGDAEFGPAAAVDLRAVEARWFERWLKNVDNGVEREPRVRIFVMGGGDGHKTPEGRHFVGGHWRDESDWPLARAQATPYYLHAGGKLLTTAPTAAPPTHFLFDPMHPVPTLGGNLSSEETLTDHGMEKRLMFRGAADQRCRPDFWLCEDARPLSARNDVLVFETQPLARDVEVTGPVTVELWVGSSAPDTDFTAKLVDVWPPNPDYPAGYDMNVGDGIVRARYRDSPKKAVFMKPGQVYPVKIELYPTSIVFGRGHRIRVDVSSSNFPRFDVNPNTGEPLNDNRRWATADNAVYHDPQHPSRILLPIVPAEER